VLGRDVLSLEGVRAGYAGYQWALMFHGWAVRHRMNRSEFGQWSQRDPARNEQGRSLYEYTNDRPIVFVDPDGRLGQWMVPLVGTPGGTNTRWVGPGNPSPTPPPDPLAACQKYGKGNSERARVKCLLVYGICNSLEYEAWFPFPGNLHCFCMNGGDDPWANEVRSCLMCMEQKGIDPHVAHDACYESADQHNPRQWHVLAEAAVICAAMQSELESQGICP